MLLFAENPVHNPAPANMRASTATVVEDVRVVTPGVLERVREDRHGAEVPRLVHLAREHQRGVGAPGREEPNPAERIAEDLTKPVGLLCVSSRALGLLLVAVRSI